MKIALVAMPWPQFDSPSAALGCLSAYIQEKHPDWVVDCKFPYIIMWQMIENLYQNLSNSQEAEFLFIPLIYPEKTGNIKKRFKRILANKIKVSDEQEQDKQLNLIFDNFLKACEALINQTVSEIATKYDVAGFTITYSQLFSSWAVAKKLKEKDPNIKIVFGGAGVDGKCGLDLIKELPFLDYIVQGEGEIPFLKLLNTISQNKQDINEPCILTKQTKTTKKDFIQSCDERFKNQIMNLDTLPCPDYDDYYKLADDLNIYWHIPIETSRGCWWNKTLTTKDPMRGCHFCNLNTGSYRQKSTAKVIQEISDITKKYNNLRLKFMDNVMRKNGLEETLDAIESLNIDLRFVAEARASIHPYHILRLWEIGCHIMQIGIEGLSTSYLKRMGKGSSTILNLQALKTCCELGIRSASNLLIHFPGATKEEVKENADNMTHYAIAYEPTELSEFRLFSNSSICAIPDKFGLSNLRNASCFDDVLPSKIVNSITTFWFDYDSQTTVDWNPVYQAKEHWQSLKGSLGKSKTFTDHPLFYTDGGLFLEIVDRRNGFRTILLEDEWREIYLYCMEIRSHKKIMDKMIKTISKEKIHKILDAFVKEKLMFSEQNKYLSLAVAASPLMAAKRIRQSFNSNP